MDIQNESLLDSEIQHLWQKLEWLQQETQHVQQQLRKLQQEKLQEKSTRATDSSRLQKEQLQQSQEVQEKRLQDQPMTTIDNLEPTHSTEPPNYTSTLLSMLSTPLPKTAIPACEELSCICKSNSKEKRFYYTSKQLLRLEEIFKIHPKLSVTDKINLAKELNVTEKKIMIWFQNKRRKMKLMSSKQMLNTKIGIMGPRIGRNLAVSTGSLVLKQPDNIGVSNTRAVLQHCDGGPSYIHVPAPSHGQQIRPPSTVIVGPTPYPKSAFTSTTYSNERLHHTLLPRTQNYAPYLHGGMKETAMNSAETNVRPTPDLSHSMDVSGVYPGQDRLPPMHNSLLFYKTLNTATNLTETNLSPMLNQSTENEESKRSRRS